MSPFIKGASALALATAAELAGADFDAARAPFSDVRKPWPTLEYRY